MTDRSSTLSAGTDNVVCMKRIWLLAAAILIIVGIVVAPSFKPSSVKWGFTTQKAAALVGNCSKGGEYYVGGHYAGIVCFYGVPGDAVRQTITCRYTLVGIAHTYNVYGPWRYWYAYNPSTAFGYGTPGTTDWSFASCGSHFQDIGGGYAETRQDKINHACPQLNNGHSYWPSSYCF